MKTFLLVVKLSKATMIEFPKISWWHAVIFSPSIFWNYDVLTFYLRQCTSVSSKTKKNKKTEKYTYKSSEHFVLS